MNRRIGLNFHHLLCWRVYIYFIFNFSFTAVQAIDESLRLLSRQFAVTKSEIEREKAAFLAHKLGTAVPPPSDVTSMAEASNVTESLGIVTDAIPNKMHGVVENATRPDPEQQGTDQLAGKQIAALNSNSSAGRFSFNPAQLMARDRWSQVWTNFVTPAASGKPDSLPAEDVKASVSPAASSTPAPSLTPVSSSTAAPSIKSAYSSTAAPSITPAVSPAVNLSQNLLSMEIEKPVKWMRDKAKVSQNITYPNLVPTVLVFKNLYRTVFHKYSNNNKCQYKSATSTPTSYT
jgi:hypothetical protein